MDFAWFLDLDRLSRTGNFSQAATLGHVSQPAFSRRIQALENWVGAPLVDRHARPVTLTRAGRQMLEAGLEALDRLESERERVCDLESMPEQRTVTFGMPHSIAWRFYPDWLRAFEALCGPVATRLRADDLPSCAEALGQGDIDFVLAYQSRFASGMIAGLALDSMQIGTDVLLPVCSPDACGAPLYAIDSNSGQGSPAVPWLRFGARASIMRHLAPLLDELGLAERLEVIYENSMAQALRLRVHDGMGVAWLPRSLVEPDLETGRLVVCGDERMMVDLTIRLYRLAGGTDVLTGRLWSRLSDTALSSA